MSALHGTECFMGPGTLNFPAKMRDGFTGKLSRTFSAHFIDVLGELAAGRVHLTKPEQHFIRTLIKMIRDKCLKLLYLLLYFCGRRILILHGAELRCLTL